MRRGQKKAAGLAPGMKKRAAERLLRYSGPFLPVLGAALLLAVVAAFFSRKIPVTVGCAIDVAVAGGPVDFRMLGRVLAPVPAYLAAGAAADWVMRLLGIRAGAGVTRMIRADCMRKLNRLPLSWLDSHSSGELLSRIIADSDRLSEGLLTGIVDLFSAASAIVVTLVFMFSLDPWVALTVALLTPLSMAVAGVIAGRSFSLFTRSAGLNASGTAVMEEAVSGLAVIKHFGREEAELSEFAKINSEYRRTATMATFVSSLTNPVTRFVNSLVYTAVALAGGLAAAAAGSPLSVGGFAALLAFSKDYAKPFNDLSGVLAETESSLASAARVFEFLDAPEEEPDPEPASAPDPSAGVTFKDVSFSYTGKPFMEGINFTAGPGQRIAIVGPTGCGKTTLVNLLMRFYDPDGGTISVGGADTVDCRRGELRSCFGMVLQDTWIASGTVRDNIALGRPDATDDEIRRAAVLARSHSFISRLPKGYDTVIGDAEGRLSAGERQLLCITRVMLSPPPLLILDEATSSIDMRTELKIRAAFDELMKGRTSFVVAHRLSTVRNADLILVMKDGRVIEQGTHDALMAADGFYRGLFDAQFV